MTGALCINNVKIIHLHAEVKINVKQELPGNEF